jgi:hypothetical protein
VDRKASAFTRAIAWTGEGQARLRLPRVDRKGKRFMCAIAWTERARVYACHRKPRRKGATAPPKADAKPEGRSNSFYCRCSGCCFSFIVFRPKSHVKPQNPLNLTNKTRSSWHLVPLQPNKYRSKKQTKPARIETPSGANSLITNILYATHAVSIFCRLHMLANNRIQEFYAQDTPGEGGTQKTVKSKGPDHSEPSP